MPTVRISTAANTDFATNSFATRRTFRRILRPSSTAAGIAAKLRPTSTRSATPFAIWLPRAEGDRDLRRLQRGHVVDAVADHRDALAVLDERLDERALLVGLDAREHDAALGGHAELARLAGQLGTCDDPPRRLEPGRAGDRLDRDRAVAGDHLDGDPGLTQEGDRLGRGVAHALGQRDQTDRLEGRDARRAVTGLGEGLACPSEQQHAALLACAHVHEGCDLPRIGDVLEQDVRCAEHLRLARPQGEAAPLPARRERHLDLHAELHAAKGLRDRVGGRVAAGEARRERAELVAHLRLGVPAERHDLVERERAVGQRAGLVDADHVDAGERLDGREPLDEGSTPGHACGADREGDGGEQHEALGHERDTAGRRGRHGFPDRRLVVAQRGEQPDGDRHHHDHEQPQEAVDVALQRRELAGASRARCR